MHHIQKYNYLFFANAETKIIKAEKKDTTFCTAVFLRNDGNDELHLTVGVDKTSAIAPSEACLW